MQLTCNADGKSNRDKIRDWVYDNKNDAWWYENNAEHEMYVHDHRTGGETVSVGDYVVLVSPYNFEVWRKADFESIFKPV